MTDAKWRRQQERDQGTYIMGWKASAAWIVITALIIYHFISVL